MAGDDAYTHSQDRWWGWSHRHLIAVGIAGALSWSISHLGPAVGGGLGCWVIQTFQLVIWTLPGLTLRWGPRTVVAVAVLILVIVLVATPFFGLRMALFTITSAPALLALPITGVLLGCLLRRTLLARWIGQEA